MLRSVKRVLRKLLKTAEPRSRARSTRPVSTKPAHAGRSVPAAPLEQFDQHSPGQAGEGATRDLTAAEIRTLRPEYRPERDGEPDPGEVVWTWVPFIEYDGRGKDRPVLIIARITEDTWAGCYLSTKHHHGFVPLGNGPWDSLGRESFLSPERVLCISRHGMRRESAGIDRAGFDRAVAAIFSYHQG